MDKNKSTYKLKNFGPVYYLNLDGQPERKEYMENQFKPKGINWFQRKFYGGVRGGDLL